MTRTQMNVFVKEVHRKLTPEDYIFDIYVSLEDTGAVIYKKCVYDILDGWLFILQENAAKVIRLPRDGGRSLVMPIQSEYLPITLHRNLQ